MSISTMPYTLCISDSCPSCERIIRLLKYMKVSVEIKDVQKVKNCDVSIIPALFKGKKLIAYGKDIIHYFKKREEKKWRLVDTLKKKMNHDYLPTRKNKITN